MRRNQKRLVVLLGSIILLGSINISASSAATQSTGTMNPILSLSIIDRGNVKPQSFAVESGGSNPSAPLSPSEIAANIGAIARAAGGAGAVWKCIDVIIVTVRVCPQCFLI